MNKLVGAILFLFVSADIPAQPIRFLEEKTAFCYSELALARYLKFAEKRILDGLKQLIIKGKCDFVPDGEIVRLENYRINTMGNTKVVEFELEDQTVWTFNALVQSVDFSNLLAVNAGFDNYIALL